jgi:hypothetical protein
MGRLQREDVVTPLAAIADGYRSINSRGATPAQRFAEAPLPLGMGAPTAGDGTAVGPSSQDREYGPAAELRWGRSSRHFDAKEPRASLRVLRAITALMD